MTVGAIRSFENFGKAAARRRTERFNRCFPRGITMGDIDSHVEINHHWLFIEWKVGEQKIQYGQLLDLERLARRPRMSVWALWTTEDGFITHGQRLGHQTSRRDVTEEVVAQRIVEWVAAVEKAPAPGSLDQALDRLAVVTHLNGIKNRLIAETIEIISAEMGAKP